jgi:hypothetical protein
MAQQAPRPIEARAAEPSLAYQYANIGTDRLSRVSLT